MDSERLARVKRKLEALNYDGDLDPKSAPLAEKLVDDLLNATNSYKSLKLRLTKQSKAQDNWEAKLMTLKQSLPQGLVCCAFLAEFHQRLL